MLMPATFPFRFCRGQVVEICQWLHRLGIVWGDAKPENFVEGQVSNRCSFHSRGALGPHRE